MLAAQKASVLLNENHRFARAFTHAKASTASTRANRLTVRCQAESEQNSLDRRAVLGMGLSLAAASQFQLAAPASAKVVSSEWEQVELPIDKAIVLLDIGFTGDDPNHGFLLGSRQTLLETFDGGKSWAPRTIEAAQDEGFNYRFTSISFNGSEGWIVGKPAILLHTNDGGKSWERVPLSAKLPGNPILVTALPGEPGQAEMTTEQGAIYVTANKGYLWRAAVQETVDGTLNRTVSSGISGASYYEGFFSNVGRSADGEYVAVSSRGNFYMTWAPGDSYWTPHNRPTGRRVQNMGWLPGNKLWLSTRGGDVLFGSGEDFAPAKLNSRGFGILDVGFLNDTIGYACGGSGSLYKSDDGGKSWKRDKSADGIAGNLYAVIFDESKGFILGNDAILLRYIGSA